jgi:Cu-Zn family superoxide dismutase
MQRLRSVGLLIASLVVVIVLGAACSKSNMANAELKNASGQVVGSATFISSGSDGGVKITVRVSGLSPGQHGIHVHSVGKCEPPDFASAGGHYNPDGKQHGLESPNGPHAGDLPLLLVAPDGTGTLETNNNSLTNRPKGKELFDADGAALVVHANADDQKTDPTGNSGGRIACGVIIHE